MAMWPISIAFNIQAQWHSREGGKWGHAPRGGARGSAEKFSGRRG